MSKFKKEVTLSTKELIAMLDHIQIVEDYINYNANGYTHKEVDSTIGDLLNYIMELTYENPEDFKQVYNTRRTEND